MNFVHPELLFVGAIACGALLAVWRRHDLRQRAALDTLVALHLRQQLTVSVSQARRIGRRVLFGSAVALLFIALAAPQAGYRWQQTTRRGNDIMFAVDTSRSMLTPDVKPNRLARAKMAIDDLVTHLDGDAVGLVAFAGTAFLQTPMTLDYGAFHESLNSLDTHIIPVGGTNISSAIRETQAALRGRPGSDKVLILVTDGEDLKGDAIGAATAAAKQDGLKIFTVGVGTSNGDLIPIPPQQGGGFLKDSDGNLVKSHLDESGLKALAAATGGSYAPLGTANQGLETIYREALAPLAKHDLQARAQKVYIQRYQWPLAISLALLLSSLMIGTRRRDAKAAAIDATTPIGKIALPTALVLLFAAGLLPIRSALASPASAVKAYDSGNFADAEREFSKVAQASPRQPLLQFNAGAAAYKAGDYPQASQAFQASVNAVKSGGGKRLAEQEDAYYNLGNSLYREGQKTEQAKAEDTIATWGRSVKAYDAALQLRADDADSKFNRDLVQRKLDALRKQQQQQQQEKQQPQKQSPPKPGAGEDSKADSPKDKSGKSKADSNEQGSKGNPTNAKDQGQSSQQKPEAGKRDAPGEKDQTDKPGSGPASAGQTPPAAPQPGTTAGTDTSATPADRAVSSAKAGAEQAAQAAQAADDQHAPGEMSRADARELLDSVKDEQQRLPAAPMARSGEPDNSPSENLKDW